MVLMPLHYEILHNIISVNYSFVHLFFHSSASQTSVPHIRYQCDQTERILGSFLKGVKFEFKYP